MKIAYCTRDITFQIRSLEKFTNDKVEFYNFRSTLALKSSKTISNFDVIIFDEEIYRIENSQGHKSATARELLEIIAKIKKDIVFVFISNSSKGFLSFEKHFKNVYLFRKNNFDSIRFNSFLRCCLIFDFIPLMADELKVGEFLSSDLFFSGKSQKSEKVYLKKETSITKSFKKTLAQKNIQHLYVSSSDSKVTFTKHKLYLSEKINQSWFRNRRFLLKALDDSGLFSAKHANFLQDEANHLIQEIHSLIDGVGNLKLSFSILPLPRVNDVNFSLNNILNVSIFSKISKSKLDLDLVLASMLLSPNINSMIQCNDIIERLRCEQLFDSLSEHFKQKGLFKSKEVLNYFTKTFEFISGIELSKENKNHSVTTEDEFIKLSVLIQNQRMVNNGELEKTFDKELLIIIKNNFSHNKDFLKIYSNLI